MNCSNCNAPLAAGVRFCPNCGQAQAAPGSINVSHSQGVVIGSGNTVTINNNPGTGAPAPGSGQPAAGPRLQELMDRCLAQYQRMHDIERQRDLTRDPQEAARARQEVAAIQAGLQASLDEYRRLSGLAPEQLPGKLRAIQVELQLEQYQAREAGPTRPALIQPQPGDRQSIRILFLSANPLGSVRLRLDQEQRKIRERLQLASQRDRFRTETLAAVRTDDLIQALLELKPNIVHFSGHGDPGGALMFEDEQGGSLPVQPDGLADLFELAAGYVECVLLNACYSKPLAEAIARHIPYVIGMSQEISDEAALAFTVGFYIALGEERTVEDAYKVGLVKIKLHGIPEHLTPVLVKKAG